MVQLLSRSLCSLLTIEGVTQIARICKQKINFVTDSCRQRGCGRVWSMDGLWKLAYPIW